MLSKPELGNINSFLSLLLNNQARNSGHVVISINNPAKPLADLLVHMGIFSYFDKIFLPSGINLAYYFPEVTDHNLVNSYGAKYEY